MSSRYKNTLRLMLRKTYGPNCHWCNKELVFNNAESKLYATVDHYPIKREMGGRLHISNTVLACAKCNSSRHKDEQKGVPSKQLPPNLKRVPNIITRYKETLFKLEKEGRRESAFKVKSKIKSLEELIETHKKEFCC